MKSQKRTKFSKHGKDFLVVFYSRSGMTRRLAREIADTLACDIEEIIDLKNRKGPLGYFTAGRDASMKVPTKIKEPIRNPGKYDVVIIGTPIWGWTVTPAIRTFIRKHKDQLKKVAFFCTMDGSGDKSAFAEMSKICGKTPLATLHVKSSEVRKCSYGHNVRLFAAKIRSLRQE
jgi:flavodoxin